MEYIKTFQEIDEEEICRINEEIEELYEKNLKQYGITLPSVDSCKRAQLIYLYYFKGKAVCKEAITNFVLSLHPDASGDQQVRHLGLQDGFNLYYNNELFLGEKVKKGYYLLSDLDSPKQAWLIKKTARSTVLKAKDFNEVKKSFGYRCATCGEKEGDPHRITGHTVVLQQGHMDPNLPLEIGNILPQCEHCNQNVYKNDFVFSPEGSPSKINNPNYIFRSNDIVQKQMYELLKRKFG